MTLGRAAFATFNLQVAAALILQVAAQAQSGVLSLVAGRGVRGYDGDGGPAAAAAIALANVTNQPCDANQFEQTSHLTVDAQGNVYFADGANQRIRKIDVSGRITTVAGTGEAVAGCAQLPESPRLFGPADVVVDRDGSLIIADQQNNRIRRLSTAGTLSTLVGNGLHNTFAPNVPGTASPMDWPSALALAPDGTLYFAEMHSNRVGMLVNGRTNSVIEVQAGLKKPAGLAIDRTGALLIADAGNHRVRRFANGTLTTIAGTGRAEYCGDGGAATAACLNTPMDVKADALGNIYIADTGNHRVRRIDPSGVMTTVAAEVLNSPCAVAVDANNDVYIVDWQNYAIRKLTLGAVPTVAAGGVVNAANFTAPVAPGSLISIFGTNFAEDAKVEVNGVAAPVLVASTGQINAQLPYETAPGTASLTVTTPAGRSAAAAVEVAAAAVGVFVYAGTNRAIADAAERGGVLVFYCTGLGAVSPAVATGRPASSETLSFATAAPVVTIGGIPAAVQFAGLAPGFIGLGQLNVIVPAEAPVGDAVPVVVQGKTVTVSIR
jgi:uncharacterized protein (TIGR03437 family)